MHKQVGVISKRHPMWFYQSSTNASFRRLQLFMSLVIMTQNFNSLFTSLSGTLDRSHDTTLCTKQQHEATKCIKILSSCHVLLTFFSDILMCALYNHICHKNGKTDAITNITEHKFLHIKYFSFQNLVLKKQIKSSSCRYHT